MKPQFEVMAFRQETNQSKANLEQRAFFSSLNSAMTIAKKWAKQYWRVEVSDVVADEYGFIEMDELVACWENGVKTL